MGVDCKLYLNTRWSLTDIQKVMERVSATEVKVEHTTFPDYLIFTMNGIGRMTHVWPAYHTPMGSMHMLSMASNPQGIKLLKGIAEVFGGLLQEEDVTEKCEIITGAMTDENALPYFLKQSLMEGNDAESLDDLIATIKAWGLKHNTSHGIVGVD